MATKGAGGGSRGGRGSGSPGVQAKPGDTKKSSAGRGGGVSGVQAKPGDSKSSGIGGPDHSGRPGSGGSNGSNQHAAGGASEIIFDRNKVQLLCCDQRFYYNYHNLAF